MRNMVTGEDRQEDYNKIMEYYLCIHKKFIVI